MSSWRLWKDESGAALFLTAITMVALLGFAALVTDVGLLYVHRVQLTNAVDAAALAGVQELPTSSWAAENRAISYAGLNGVDDGLSVEVSPNRREIGVQATRPVNLIFARLFGLSTAQVSARSKAVVGPVRSYRGAVPLSVKDQEFVFGEQYVLKYSSHGVDRGNFGALKLGDKPGAKAYENNFKYGYDGTLSIGDIVETEPGNMAGPTAKALEYRMDLDRHNPNCTWKNGGRDLFAGCARLVIVPVIGDYSKGGRNDVEIVGFAAFFLEGAVSKDEVAGRFIEMAVDGDVGSGRNYGVSAYRLVDW